MKTAYALLTVLATAYLPLSATEKPFFQASSVQPYHLSVGAVLFNDEGQVACHHFKEILGQKDVYILMRESVENDENILETLHRGLKEEFGAQAAPIAFLGSLSGFLPDSKLSFDKTTLYIACKVTSWHPEERNLNDLEGTSMIEWLPPETLISIMEKQGKRFKRVDADESEMIRRALKVTAQ
ncbi:MAG: NUDIX hydrolase [Parachlamydiaceae bacterium]|nr:NUDIX hydrolase [Parachlamydiaceae bacterium]